MAETKYGKYILTEPKPYRGAPPTRADAPPNDMTVNIMYLDDEYLKGAFYTECDWLVKGYPKNVWVQAHTHDFDEIIAFLGSNPNDPKNLYGEIEMWLEDEKFIITKSCLIFVPKGMKHCPLTIKRVDRPIFHLTSGPGKAWGAHYV
jgi:hypothetical protein